MAEAPSNALEQYRAASTSQIRGATGKSLSQNNSRGNLNQSYQLMTSLSLEKQIAPVVQTQNDSYLVNNMKVMMMQMEQLALQQSMMGENLRVVQDQVKNEVSSLRMKANEMENQLLELRLLCNGKVSGEDMAVVIDKKLQVL